MIIYTTKETFERFKLKLPGDMSSPLVSSLSQTILEQEHGDSLLEWGGKLFYFDRRKCIQVVNFASKLTLFLIDIKLDDLPDVGNLMANYLFDLYDGNTKMTRLLNRFFSDYPAVAFSRLQNRSVIAQLNQTQSRYLDDGYRLYDYIEDGILHSRRINRDINREWYFTEKINGKREYFNSAERFEKLLKARYKV